MEWGLLQVLARQNGVCPFLNEEGSGEGVSPEDGQVQQAVALRVHTVQVTVVRDQRVRNALVPTQQSQVEGDVPIIITLIQLLGELGKEGGGSAMNEGSTFSMDVCYCSEGFPYYSICVV